MLCLESRASRQDCAKGQGRSAPANLSSHEHEEGFRGPPEGSPEAHELHQMA